MKNNDIHYCSTHIIDKPKTIYKFTKKLKKLNIDKKLKIKLIHTFNENINDYICQTLVKEGYAQDKNEAIEVIRKVDSYAYQNLLQGKKHKTNNRINVESIKNKKLRKQFRLKKHIK